MESLEAVLKAVPLFSALPDEEIKALARATVVRSYPKHRIIVTEGERSDSLYVILSGRVKVYVSDDAGKDLVLNFEGPGEWFGELALDEGPRSASVATIEPAKMAVIQNDILRQFLATYPTAALAVIRALIARARHMTAMIKDIAMLDVYGRVAKLLLELARDVDGRLIVEERLTQQAIGERVNASREMVSRILKDLSIGGYITHEPAGLVIHRIPRRGW